ncbi:A-kinase anchor protein 12 isoform X2 [Tachyglossus aculeatus]|uniref:A-kinase anchor protein 12 isoform X2 n=1 Tax=Tachyglossus aculeatus TaxID=9261 RepID=UPI0018F31E60|nr:A-kinase anchor protein 12 isoform X2 [Tachyglossus aculeatus]
MLGTITITVGQNEPENMVDKEDSDKLVPSPSAAAGDDVEDKGEEESASEVIEQLPSPEDNSEEAEQASEPQSNDVGFKKVFKFVGFKFTVKKDKTEKSDPVQLLTVKKDDAGDHDETKLEEGKEEAKEDELTQTTEIPEEPDKTEQGKGESPPDADYSGEPLEESKDSTEEKKDKEGGKTPESPTNPLASETASPFKKFFTQGWAGWRKKTSFRKPKEDEPEVSEKKKEQEPEKTDVVGTEVEEHGPKGDAPEKLPTSKQLPDQETPEGKGAIEDVKGIAPEEPAKELETVPDVKTELSLEGKTAPLATEIFDEKLETVAEVHVHTVEEKIDQKVEVVELDGSLPLDQSPEAAAEQQKMDSVEELSKAKEVYSSEGDHDKHTEISPEESASCRPPEGITNEAEILSSQERIKLQGSPLKKLFIGTGLKKLSGKKQKGKRGGGGDEETKPEESGEPAQASADSPESPEEQKGESSASSPEESNELTLVEKGSTEAPQDGEVEEGAVSDGERKREGVTPWASFKKMVTPKKRVRRPSESDKEDEVDKAKSATMSSTESAASEAQEETKGNGEEPKTEEPKRKVDTSVSWEALICVGSSKKRARKSSSSDEEGGQKPGGDGQKTVEEPVKSKEAGAEVTLANSQENDHGPGSSSPEQAGSPSEGEGVSTWESFKRLVTPRKKSKSKMEEKTEESATVSGPEHSDVEAGKDESWVSIKKFIPGRRKKKSDGKQEHAPVEEMAEGNEEDSDVPAVVPLAEYDAAEREKIEAHGQAAGDEAVQRSSVEDGAETVAPGRNDEDPQELIEGLVHAVTVTVVEGERAVTSIEERSPSWISASVTGPVEPVAEGERKQRAEEILEEEAVAEETSVVIRTLTQAKDTSDDTIVSDLEFTSEAVTAPDEATEASCVEEAMEASCAEETTEMVSAVSRLTESPDTTEEATPVQEVEGNTPDLEDLNRRTQEVLQAVAEKVKETETAQVPDGTEAEGAVQAAGSKDPEGKGPLQDKPLIERSLVEAGENEKKATETSQEISSGAKELLLKAETEYVSDDRQGQEQTTSERIEKVPEIKGRVEESTSSENKLYSDVKATSQPGILAVVESQDISTGRSAETSPDEATEESTPVADFEDPTVLHQEKVNVSQELDAVVDAVTHLGSVLTEALVRSEVLPEDSGSQLPEEKLSEEPSSSEALGSVKKDTPAEAIQIPSGYETMQQAGGHVEDEDLKAAPVEEDVQAFPDPAIIKSDDDQQGVREVEPEEETGPEEPKVEQNVGDSENKELESDVKSYSTQVREETVVQDEAVTSEILKVESPEAQKASLSRTAAEVEEKVVAETAKVSGTEAETLEPVDVKFAPEEMPSETDQDLITRQSEQTAGVDRQPSTEPASPTTEPVSETVTAPASAAVAEESKSSDPEQGCSQELHKLKPDEAEDQTVLQETSQAPARVETGKDENQTLESQSSKIVQNVIQTAVEQLVDSEEPGAETSESSSEKPVRLTETESQEAVSTVETDEKVQAAPQLPTKCEVKPVTVEEDSVEEKTAVEPTVDLPVTSDLSKEDTVQASGAQKSRLPVEEQHCEATVALPEDDKAVIGTEPPLKDDHDLSGERTDKPKLGPEEENKGDLSVGPSEDQTPGPEEANVSKEVAEKSPDANGPKLEEEENFQGVESREGLVVEQMYVERKEEVCSESLEDVKTQKQEEASKDDGESGVCPPKSASEES